MQTPSWAKALRNFFSVTPEAATPPPAPRIEGAADWTARTIASAQQVSGTAPLSKEAQAWVDREIAAVRGGSGTADASQDGVIVDFKTQGGQGSARAREVDGGLSPEAQAGVYREIRAARQSLGQALGQPADVIKQKDTGPAPSHLRPR